jgi:hypothetical protein
MKSIHKLNGGLGATLCHQCSVIISTGLTDDLYCKECNKYRKELLQEIMKEDEDLGLYIEQMEKEEPKQETLTYTEAVKKEERIFNSIMMKQETLEYDLLQHIKFCLECKNESQAIRLIEKYGFVKQEEKSEELETAISLLKQTTEYEVLDSWKEKVKELEQLINKI